MSSSSNRSPLSPKAPIISNFGRSAIACTLSSWLRIQLRECLISSLPILWMFVARIKKDLGLRWMMMAPPQTTKDHYKSNLRFIYAELWWLRPWLRDSHRWCCVSSSGWFKAVLKTTGTTSIFKPKQTSSQLFQFCPKAVRKTIKNFSTSSPSFKSSNMCTQIRQISPACVKNFQR